MAKKDVFNTTLWWAYYMSMARHHHSMADESYSMRTKCTSSHAIMILDNETLNHREEAKLFYRMARQMTGIE